MRFFGGALCEVLKKEGPVLFRDRGNNNRNSWGGSKSLPNNWERRPDVEFSLRALYSVCVCAIKRPVD